MNDAGPSRRRLLAATGLLGVAACTRDDSPKPTPPVDPDVAIRRVVAEDIATLVALYDAIAKAHPGLAGRLSPLAAETSAHLGAVRDDGSRQPTATSSGTASATPSAPSVVPAANPAAALAGLATAEAQASGRRVTQLGNASPALARLIAAIGASEAAHAALLRSPR